MSEYQISVLRLALNLTNEITKPDFEGSTVAELVEMLSSLVEGDE